MRALTGSQPGALSAQGRRLPKPMLVSRVIGLLEPGGAQLSALRLTLALHRHGVESRVLAGHATEEGLRLFAAEGVEVEAWNGDPGIQYACSRPFAHWLEPRLAGAEVVHAHMFGAWWAAASALQADTPLVASEHNALRWPGPPPRAAMKAALSCVDTFFAHGPAASALALELGLPAERLATGLSPIEPTPASPMPGLPKRRIVFAGRLHEEKGPDLLIAALGRMRRPPTLLVLGSGPLDAALRRQASALGLERLVRFAGWQRNPAEWIAGASACVVPSRHEAWSQTAVLAMALGVPVVGTAVEGLPQTLGEGRGILVSPGDPDSIASALEELLDGRRTPDLAAAREYASRFTPERVATLYATDYRRLSRNRDPRSP